MKPYALVVMMLLYVAGSTKPERPVAIKDELIEAALDAPTEPERQAAYERWQTRQDEYAKKLSIIVADDNEPDERRYYAVRILGKMRSRGAIRVFARCIDWYYAENDGANGGTRRLQCYPCAEALRGFGAECIPAILQVISTKRKEDVTDDMLRRSMTIMLEAFGRPSASRCSEVIAVVERVIGQMPADRPDWKVNPNRLLAELRAYNP
jgi:hypothetical protein